MPRPLILFFALSLFSANLYAEDAKKPSPAVKKILDEAVRDVKKNRQEFDKANQKPLEDARSSLEELSRQQTKDGKTKEAIATLQQVETLERDVMAMVSGGKPTLSPGLKEILDQAVLGVMANRQALQKANDTPLSEARSALEELAKKQTKDGKTKEAITTLQQVETLERDVLTMAGAPVAPKERPKKPQPEQTLASFFVGRWANETHPLIVVIQANGQLTELWKSNGTVKTTGEVRLVQPDQATGEIGGDWTIHFSRKDDGSILMEPIYRKAPQDAVILRRLP